MNFDVFISYPYQEKARADAVRKKLESAGIRCWIAPRDLSCGVGLPADIASAIDQCRSLILIFSSHASESKQICREIEHALFGAIPITVLRFEKGLPVGALADLLGVVAYSSGSCVRFMDMLTPISATELEGLLPIVRMQLDRESLRRGPTLNAPMFDKAEVKKGLEAKVQAEAQPAKTRPRREIFISYRRDDDPGMALALHAHLVDAFTESRIFMDVEDGIPPGHDFVRVLEERVAECYVMLAIIGKGWLVAKDSNGRRRLDNTEDFVRVEIESAMRLGKLVIPVLVNDTEMPQAAVLPNSMKPFARRQAVWITSKRLRADAEGLIGKIQQAVQQAQGAVAVEKGDRHKSGK